MRGPGLRSRLGVCVAMMFLASGCASGPAASPASTVPPPVTSAPGTPAIATPAAPSAAPSPSPTTIPAASPTPLRSLPASFIGEWTGVVREPAGIVEYWSATYSLNPCASAEECGSWSWVGPITRTSANYPWAVLGETIECSGSLRYKGEARGEFAFTQATTEFKTAPGGTDCGVWTVRLEPTPDGGVGIAIGNSSHDIAHGTLQRADGSPAPSASS